MSNWSDYFRNVQFHRIPFLTVDLLALLIPQMPKLEVLGVYKCPLIHIGHGMKLLQIIRTDRPLGEENQVDLDFYPRLHRGPIESPSEYCVGAFGVSTTFSLSCLQSQHSHSSDGTGLG